MEEEEAMLAGEKGDGDGERTGGRKPEEKKRRPHYHRETGDGGGIGGESGGLGGGGGDGEEKGSKVPMTPARTTAALFQPYLDVEKK